MRIVRVVVRWLGYLLAAMILITTCLLVAAYMGEW